MEENQKTQIILLCCAATALILLGGALGFCSPFWQLGYRAVEPEAFDLQRIYRVDINSAGIDGFCSLPGIGEKKARAIVTYRQLNGPFSSIEELENVDGISEKSIELWRSRLYIETDDTQKRGD